MSLTEDPIAGIPVAQDLAQFAKTWHSDDSSFINQNINEQLNPFAFSRRRCTGIKIGKPPIEVGDKHPPTVIASTHLDIKEVASIVKEVAQSQTQSKDAPVEGIIIDQCFGGLLTCIRSQNHFSGVSYFSR